MKALPLWYGDIQSREGKPYLYGMVTSNHVKIHPEQGLNPDCTGENLAWNSFDIKYKQEHCKAAANARMQASFV
ncbi:hypothetical protein DPMN_111982 [Dreissena polymorpha]|uniref:Uncharacterized protein n=1 Tax=Dreissena polymorpha TaxID=45954 RepID=A0A9D4QPI1_DREPO|nr:hypothetical protein DPMN_111982 [Dreissena polymorpha]